MNKNTLVVYFTWSSTSQKIAERIQALLQADIFQIQTEKIYPDTYLACIVEAGKEKMKKERPVLRNYLQSIEQYEKIILVFPNWWGGLPMPVFTFLEHLDFSEKTILPVCMNGGSGFSKTIKQLQETCPTAKVLEGIEIKKKAVESEETQKRLEKWLRIE